MHSIMDVKGKKTKKNNEKQKEDSLYLYMLSSQWKTRTVYRARSVYVYCVYICFVYVSHERLSAADPYRAMVNDLLLSPPFH